MVVLGDEGEVRASDYLPGDAPAVRKIKGELMCVESAIPEQAMVAPDWARVAWIKAVQARCCPRSPCTWSPSRLDAILSPCPRRSSTQCKACAQSPCARCRLYS
jgi:hypothetical protein